MSFKWEDITYGGAAAPSGILGGSTIFQPNLGAWGIPDYPTFAVDGKGGITPQSKYNSQLNILLIGGAAVAVVWLLLK